MTEEPAQESVRFEFGRNWARFAQGVGEAEILQAEVGLNRLLPTDDITGMRMLDIGCGSGLHALAALRLGAVFVDAVDLDPASVQTARSLLSLHAPQGAWSVQQASVFDLADTQYDIIYSWGVLHHTGDMNRAIAAAARQVKTGGLFAFALYRRTPACRFWMFEKRLYAGSGPRLRRHLETAYRMLFRLVFAVRGESYRDYVAGYVSTRGMSFGTDLVDWLGGYPYQSITPHEVAGLMAQLGFHEVRKFVKKPGIGVLGTGCDEYVYRRGP